MTIKELLSQYIRMQNWKILLSNFKLSKIHIEKTTANDTKKRKAYIMTCK